MESIRKSHLTYLFSTSHRPKGGLPLFSALRRIRRGEGKEGIGEISQINVTSITKPLLNNGGFFD
ncbi:MAG: hypothetical protein A2Z47_01270 [Thermodesulfovibrio sp. RBG_19FT_COMBO_42_12]|nr:MAG: hypothetical protein A2Z47_01270 [Thermodesulfovibrio sp. RBG_19FT_COMBO_42_12]